MGAAPDPAPAPGGGWNQKLYIPLGVIVLCCVCCGLALLFQYLLQTSDFTLVRR
jgi:hypothetical protein